MKSRIGQRFEGRIQGFSAKVVFITLDAPFVEVGVPLGALGGNFWIDEHRTKATGLRGTVVLTIGDAVEVEITAVDEDLRRISAWVTEAKAQDAQGKAFQFVPTLAAPATLREGDLEKPAAGQVPDAGNAEPARGRAQRPPTQKGPRSRGKAPRGPPQATERQCPGRRQTEGPMIVAPSPVRCLGVDPGSLACGWAVVERFGSRMTLVEAGVIRSPRGADFDQRILRIHERLAEAIAAHHPGYMAVESPFVEKNAATALKLGQIRGGILLTARPPRPARGRLQPHAGEEGRQRLRVGGQEPGGEDGDDPAELEGALGGGRRRCRGSRHRPSSGHQAGLNRAMYDLKVMFFKALINCHAIHDKKSRNS